jgi:RHS repeat-associated protein
MIAVLSSANQQHKSSPQRERHIYGSSRLGMDTRSVELIASFFVSPSADGTIHTTNADDRVYELTNHLGNVLATFTARKLPLAANGVFTGFSPHVTSLTDYYPFGSGMAGRTVTEGYRYGFNAMEREDDLYAPGSAYDFGARMYDGRLGRWWSVDPFYGEYSAFSTYAFAMNSVLQYIDPTGGIIVPAANMTEKERERFDAALKLVEKNTPELYTFLQSVKYNPNNGGKFMLDDDPDYFSSQSFDVIIEVNFRDLDGVSRNDELRNKPNGTVLFFGPIKSPHAEGESVLGPTVRLRGGYEQNGALMVLDANLGDYVQIRSIEDLEKVKPVGHCLTLVADGQPHWIVSIDDYTGSKFVDGQLLSHELGHVEGDILHPLNALYFETGGRKTNSGHEDGNKSGTNANDRQTEYNSKK